MPSTIQTVTKGCYAKEVIGKKVSKNWKRNCSIRVRKHLCCRDCDIVAECRTRCNRTMRECPYYLTKAEVSSNILAYRLNPRDEHWQKGSFPKLIDTQHLYLPPKPIKVKRNGTPDKKT